MGPTLRAALEIGMKGGENFRKAQAGFAAVRGEMSKVQSITGRGVQAWRSMTNVLGIAGRAFGKVLGILRQVAMVGGVAFAGVSAALGMIARKAVAAQVAFENVEVMLRTAFGPAAARAFEVASKFSIKTPFTTQEVAKGAIFLKQLKVVGTSVLDLRKWMRLAGDMAGAMGQSFLDSVLAIGYGLQGESERLKQFGITARDLIAAGAKGAASGLGVTTQTAEAAKAYLGAIEKLIGTRFRGGAAALSRTLTGLWSTFRDIADFLWSDLAKAGAKGASMFDSLKGTVRSLNRVLNELRESDTWRRFSTAVSESFGILITKGRESLERGIPRWAARATTALESVKTWLDENWDTAWTAAANAVAAASEWIKRATSRIIEAAKALKGINIKTLAEDFGQGMIAIELSMLRAAMTAATFATKMGIAVFAAASLAAVLSKGKFGVREVLLGAGVTAGGLMTQKALVKELKELKAREAELVGGRAAAIKASGYWDTGERKIPAATGRAAARGMAKTGFSDLALRAGAGRTAAAGRAMGFAGAYGGINVHVDVSSYDPDEVARQAGEATRRELATELRKKKRAAVAPS